MNIGKIARNLMIEEPLYGLYLLNLNKLITDKIPTAAVGLDGINTILYINEKFWEEGLKNDLQRVAILKHELLHICFQHLTTIFDDLPDKKLLNIAQDIEINQLIKNLPDFAVKLDSFPTIILPPKAGSRKYYQLLQQNQKSNNPDKKLSDLLSNMDKEELTWEEIQDMINNGDLIVDHSTWEEFDKLSNSEKELAKAQIEHVLKQVAQEVQKNRGKIPGELDYLINELFKPKEEVFNWKAYFRRLTGTSYNIFTKKSQRKISHRFEDSAGIKIRKKHHIFVAIDTSGSVSNKELLEFFSEIYHIYKTGTKITIGEVDTKMNNIYEYKGKFDGKITGRGGTDFDPAINYFNENINKYTTLIYFTDGYAPAEHLKPRKNIIWIISSTGTTDQKYPGHVVKIPAIKKNK